MQRGVCRFNNKNKRMPSNPKESRLLIIGMRLFKALGQKLIDQNMKNHTLQNMRRFINTVKL